MTHGKKRLNKLIDSHTLYHYRLIEKNRVYDVYDDHNNGSSITISIDGDIKEMTLGRPSEQFIQVLALNALMYEGSSRFINRHLGHAKTNRMLPIKVYRNRVKIENMDNTKLLGMIELSEELLLPLISFTEHGKMYEHHTFKVEYNYGDE